jgi:hypothetical protein
MLDRANAGRHMEVNTLLVTAAVLIAGLDSVSIGADRRWQMGTWVDAGIKRTSAVGDPAHERMPPGFNKPVLTEVATYVIETDDRRFELQEMAAIGQNGLDLQVTIGTPVTFAIEKKTAYIKIDGREYRLLVVKSERKPGRRDD